MRYIIRTVEGGIRLGHGRVEEKRAAARRMILDAGMQYLEHEAMLGSLDALGQRVEERVYVIEAVVGNVYV